ncbi:MAG: IS110 family transposase [Acidobacteriia bacterium]|nr:IS110 family transposase [Terriglobia bacterium]
MKIIGCDFHPSFQQIAMVDTETGEHTGRRLTREEAAEFYRGLSGPVIVGMEACGNTLWLERLLAELGHELRMGDAAKIRAMEVRKQKTDRRDAELLLTLLVEGRFPQVWVPGLEQRDTRQLLLHRQKLVSVRRQIKNQLQHLALNQGVQQKRKLWTQKGRQLLEELPLTGWTARRRADDLQLLEQLNRSIAELDTAVEQAAAQDGIARLLQTHPGVGPITALAFGLTLGRVDRFAHSKQVVSYLGLNPAEHSSGGRQRLGSISKQGNPMLRSLLVEAGQSAARLVPELKRAYQRLKHRKHAGVAKVMVARKLAVRLYWIWRTQQPYSATRMQGSPSHLVGEG